MALGYMANNSPNNKIKNRIWGYDSMYIVSFIGLGSDFGLENYHDI